MLNVQVPPDASATAEDGADLDCPHSLRNRGPAQVAILDKRGIPVPIDKNGYVLYCGQSYTICVKPQPPDAFGSTSQVTIVPGETLRTLTPAPINTAGNLSEYTSLVKARTVRPTVVHTEIVITMQHTRWGNFVFYLPVVVRPSLRNQIAWVFGVGIVSLLGRAAWIFLVGANAGPALNPATLLQDDALWVRAGSALAIMLGAFCLLGRYPIPGYSRED